MHDTPSDARSTEPSLALVYTEHALLLVKQRPYDWRALQAEFFDYKASLGPYTVEGLFELLEHEYGARGPFARADVAAFVADPRARVLSGA